MAEAYLELGTNLGDRIGYLARALSLLEETDGVTLGVMSRVYRSKAWGVMEQPDFLNICIQIETTLQPHALLAECKRIEKVLGRQVRERWGPREIDVDILMMQGVDIDTPTLTIPHARLAERRFVLDPLSDIAPRWEFDGVPVSLLAETLRADEPEQECMPDEKATQRLAELRGSLK